MSTQTAKSTELTNFSDAAAANPLALAIEAGLLPGLFDITMDNDDSSDFVTIETEAGTMVVRKICAGVLLPICGTKKGEVGLDKVTRRQRVQALREATICDALPTDSLEHYGPKGEWAKLGFKIGKRVAGDPLFTHVELPEGWKKRSNGSAFWNDIVDANGNVRMKYFYDGAFYNRRAHMGGPNSRYRTTPGARRSTKPGEEYVETLVIDNTLAVWYEDGSVCDEAVIYTYGEAARDGEKWTTTQERVDAHIKNWLAMNYPEHDDPFAYWP